MRIEFKVRHELVERARSDLLRPHEFAHERVGYFHAKASRFPGGILICGFDYAPVADDDYLDVPGVGAMLGPDGLRAAMQTAYDLQVGMFHAHLHAHRDRPWFSPYDLKENAKFVPDMFNVASGSPHGALVLSYNSLAGLCWVARGIEPLRVDRFSVVGAPFRIWSTK